MQDKRTRRRLLADMLFLGGAVVGASVLTRTEPFFEHLLEGQKTVAKREPAATPVRHDIMTQAYPSDSDSHEPSVTCSTSDFDDYRRPRHKPTSSTLTPFWSFFS